MVFKRNFRALRKIGHGGTLDPDVVGVLRLPWGLTDGWCMQDEGKIYEERNHFGIFHHDGKDASREVIRRTPVEASLDAAEVGRP